MNIGAIISMASALVSIATPPQPLMLRIEWNSGGYTNFNLLYSDDPKRDLNHWSSYYQYSFQSNYVIIPATKTHEFFAVQAYNDDGWISYGTK